MADAQMLLRQAVVVFSVIIYWGGVLLNARRIRKRIGKSPNLAPHTTKERLLWLSWLIVISGWAAQPFILHFGAKSGLFSFIGPLNYSAGAFVGIGLAVCGYAGTLWCYQAMGTAWRIGVDKNERTDLIQNGPYRFIRHPIYLFQSIILLGVICLLPTLFSLFIFCLHFATVLFKANDEEIYLADVYGAAFHSYCLKTGRFLPRLSSLAHSIRT